MNRRKLYQKIKHFTDKQPDMLTSINFDMKPGNLSINPETLENQVNKEESNSTDIQTTEIQINKEESNSTDIQTTEIQLNKEESNSTDIQTTSTDIQTTEIKLIKEESNSTELQTTEIQREDTPGNSNNFTHEFEELINKEHEFLSSYKVGVIVTTHGKNFIFAKQAVCSLRKQLKDAVIILFLNEFDEENIIEMIECCLENNIIHIIVKNQEEYGGLTGTWNRGIEILRNYKCSVIILSNDDILCNESIQSIILSAAKSEFKKDFVYFGPLTNNPGPADENKKQHFLHCVQITNFQHDYNLNGFFMVFPMFTLENNKFDEKYYFDPNIPFGGNEVEWYNRFKLKNGTSIIVPETFIYHYKLKLWRPNIKYNDTCIYFVNTRNYDKNPNQNLFIDNFLHIDCLIFLDNLNEIKELAKLNFIPYYVENKCSNSNILQRSIKSCPHKFLPWNYTTSIYIDMNTIIKNYVYFNDLLTMFITNNYDLLCLSHPKRNTIKSEINEIVNSKLEFLENAHYVYNDINFTDNIGLTETNILFRKHLNLINFGNEWLKNIKFCCRDQCSFDYLLWKYSIKFHRIEISNILDKKLFVRSSHLDNKKRMRH